MNRRAYNNNNSTSLYNLAITPVLQDLKQQNEQKNLYLLIFKKKKKKISRDEVSKSWRFGWVLVQ